MPPQVNSTRRRLIQAALELFASQGVTATTTRQIAEAAGVNEVTLFRQFGSKHGLLLAVIEEASIFTQVGRTLIRQDTQASTIYQVLKDYAAACLQALDRVPEVVRSVVGEAGQFPSENREALGQGFTQANRYVAAYFETVIQQGHLSTHLSAEQLASLLHGMLLGYAVIEFTSEFHHLWQDREDFLENLVTLFLHGAVSPSSSSLLPTGIPVNDDRVDHPPEALQRVADLPSSVVHGLLQHAKKVGLQEYALLYVLFAAGLSAAEVVGLGRSHLIQESQQHLLQITHSTPRSVPLNQWILGKRYGSNTRNPLTQWLKSRKDQQSALFLNADGEPLSEAELRQYWATWTQEFSTPTSSTLTLEQTQQTWRVEMLMRGMSVDNLSILTGRTVEQLQPYVHRAREKAALEEAMRLDQKG